MTEKNIKAHCIKLIKNFLKEKKLTIDNLMNYQFSELQYNESDLLTYGWQLRNPDCDDCEIVKAIMYLFYKNQGLTIEGDINKIQSKFQRNCKYETIILGTIEKPYRMDTMNSFNTLLKEKFNKKTMSYEPDLTVFDSETGEKVKSFYKNFQTIGNFIMLPNKSIDKYTINTYRAGIREDTWRDYFDIFLFELKKCLDDKSKDCDEGLLELVKINQFYFNQFSKDNKFNNFLKLNKIENFYKEKETDLFYRNGNYSHWDYDKSKKNKLAYSSFVIKYIDYAEEKIQNRSQSIIEVIKKELKN